MNRKKKQKTNEEIKKEAESKIKTGHLKGSFGDYPNDPRIDY